MNKVFINFQSLLKGKLVFYGEPLSVPFLRKIFFFVLNRLSIKNKELSVLICDNDYIQMLNNKFRQKDSPTDVLSFQNEQNFYNSKDKLLGDIAISMEMTILNAKQYGKSFEEELCSLIIHGILHLLGYDHEKNEEEAKVMKNLENTLLREVKNTFIC